jgi:hypothetical protein
MSDEDIQTEVKHLSEKGGIMIITVGSTKQPATKDDMERVADTVQDVVSDMNNIRTLVVPHLVKVDMIPIKSLFELAENND